MTRIITILFLFLSLHAGAQHGMLLAKPAAGAGTTYLLDTYTGAAAAYAVNKLKSDADSCMVIRRSSDNATQLIGFSGDDIDESAINSHCSGTDCFVVRLCDQTGQGYDATQTNEVNQPQIVSSGTIITNSDGFPAIHNTADNKYLDFPAAVTNGNLSMWLVTQSASAKDQGMILGNSSDGGKFIGAIDGGSSSTSVNSSASGTLYADGSSLSSPTRGTLHTAYHTDVTVLAGFVGTLTTWPSTLWLRYAGAGFISQNKFSLLVFYGSDQSSNRTGIENNINTYYSIY